MRYAIIPKKMAERYGIDPRLHRSVSGGRRVVISEVELRRLGTDNIESTARSLSAIRTEGGRALLTTAECIAECNRLDADRLSEGRQPKA